MPFVAPPSSFPMNSFHNLRMSQNSEIVFQMNRRRFLKASVLAAGSSRLEASAAASLIDLRRAVVVIRLGELRNAEKTAATVLIDEVFKRTGIRLRTSTSWPATRPTIAVTSQPKDVESR